MGVPRTRLLNDAEEAAELVLLPPGGAGMSEVGVEARRGV